MGSNPKKSKNFKKRRYILVHIPGNQESEGFTVEIDMVGQVPGRAIKKYKSLILS
jgi:hypothetical protein